MCEESRYISHEDDESDRCNALFTTGIPKTAFDDARMRRFEIFTHIAKCTMQTRETRAQFSAHSTNKQNFRIGLTGKVGQGDNNIHGCVHSSDDRWTYVQSGLSRKVHAIKTMRSHKRRSGDTTMRAEISTGVREA